MHATLNCQKWRKISVFIPHSFIIPFIVDIRNMFLNTYVCEVKYCITQWTQYKLSVYITFIFADRVSGASKLGSFEDKQVFRPEDD